MAITISGEELKEFVEDVMADARLRAESEIKAKQSEECIDNLCESIASVNACPSTCNDEEMKRERLKNPSVLGPFQRLSEAIRYSSASRFLTW